MASRRKALIAIGSSISTVAIAGCIDSSDDTEESGLDDTEDPEEEATLTIRNLDVRDRESEAWDELSEGMEVYESIDESTEGELEDARNVFDSANETYNELWNEVSENIEGSLIEDDLNFFNRLESWADAASDVISIELGESVDGVDDPEPFRDSVNTQIEEASEIWENSEELQDVLVDRSF